MREQANSDIEDPIAYIQKMNYGKNRVRPTIQDFLQLLDMDHKLKSFKDKGIYIEAMAQIVHKLHLGVGENIQKLIKEIFPVQKRHRERPEAEEEKSRRRKPNKKNVQPVVIEELVNQSISNPSNIDRDRIQDNNIKLGQDLRKDENSERQSKKSKGSKDQQFKKSLPQPNFNEDLQQIMEEQGVNFETTDMNAHIENENITDLEQINSNSQSSTNSNKLNLTKYQNILGNANDVTLQKNTVQRRNRGRGQGTTTARRNNFSRGEGIYDEVIQESNIRQEGEILFDWKLHQKKIAQKEEAKFLTIFNHQLDFFNKEMGIDEIFNTGNLQNMRLAFKRITKTTPGQNKAFSKHHNVFDREMEQDNFEVDGEFQDFTTNNMAFDLPTVDFPQLKGLSQFEKDKISLGMFENDKMTIKEIEKKTNKKRSDIFQEMLWRSQNGDIEMHQESPEHFSEITISLKI